MGWEESMWRGVFVIRFRTIHHYDSRKKITNWELSIHSSSVLLVPELRVSWSRGVFGPVTSSSQTNNHLHSYSPLQTIWSLQLALHACFQTVGGTSRTCREAAQDTYRACQIHSGRSGLESNPRPSCYEAAALTTTPLHHPLNNYKSSLFFFLHSESVPPEVELKDSWGLLDVRGTEHVVFLSEVVHFKQ